MLLLWKIRACEKGVYYKGGVERNMKGKESILSNTQSRVASTLNEGEIFYSKTTTIVESKRRFAKVWLIDLVAT